MKVILITIDIYAYYNLYSILILARKEHFFHQKTKFANVLEQIVIMF